MERPVIAGEFAPLHPGSDQAEAPAPLAPPALERSVIVELLGGQGQVRSRTRLTMLPAVIGRGYDADVFVDDPHVCARHAELAWEADGSLVLRDLGSVNGIGRTRVERAAQIPLASGDRVRLGPVEIRVVDTSHPVPAAVPLAEARGLTTNLLRPSRALGVCAGALAVLALLNYQNSAASEAAVPAMQEAVYILAAVAIWASAWALATRLVSKGFRFLPHWAWALGIGVLALVTSAVGEWIDFVGPSIEAGTVLAAAGGFVLLPVLIAGHLEIASTMSLRKRWRAALSVGGILVALTLVASLGDDGMENTWSLDFSGTLKPLPERMVPAMSLEGFMQATASLQGEVDAMAEEPAPDEPAAIDVPLVEGEAAPADSAAEAP